MSRPGSRLYALLTIGDVSVAIDALAAYVATHGSSDPAAMTAVVVDALAQAVADRDVPRTRPSPSETFSVKRATRQAAQ